MVLAGVDLLEVIYKMRGGSRATRAPSRDGDPLDEGVRIADVVGSARTLLECERVALNFLQRLSGVATLAHQFAAAGRHAVPRSRYAQDHSRHAPLEKAAAAAGGITNHRMGLFDAILIKNNHIAAAGGVRQAIESARASGLPVEIEVRTIDELNEALASGATISCSITFRRAGRRMGARIIGRATVELSGGIDLDSVRNYAETGADFVSVGAITHSARAMDIAFRLELL